MRIWTPTDLTMSSINLKSVATTTAGIIIPAERLFQFTFSAKFTVTGGPGTTGLASWIVDIFADEGGSVLLHSITAVTAINTKVDATYSMFTFGGAGAVPWNGTMATGADALKVCPYVRPRFAVTEVSDATTATADVYVIADGWER